MILDNSKFILNEILDNSNFIIKQILNNEYLMKFLITKN